MSTASPHFPAKCSNNPQLSPLAPSRGFNSLPSHTYEESESVGQSVGKRTGFLQRRQRVWSRNAVDRLPSIRRLKEAVAKVGGAPPEVVA
jgi:hypothetical protein